MSTKDLPNVEEPPTVKKGPAPKKRSQKRFERSQGFREKKGEEFMAENQKRLDEKLFADFGGFDNFVKTTTVETNTRPIILPITTRGIVYALNKAIATVKEELPKISQDMGYLVQKRLLCFADSSKKTGEAIASLIFNKLDEFRIPLHDCRSQGYNNGSNMKGAYKGVQAVILRKNPQALY